jgi:NAD(P)-dependent dehydrogenase (short-subunit alcohol dehydrogenase family)
VIERTSGLEGKVVLVAGASTGMGRSTAMAAGAGGASVVLAARNGAALAGARDEIVSAGGEGTAVEMDATDRAAVDRAVALTVERYGRMDVLVDCVGANMPRRTLLELTAESWAWMLEVNLTTAFHLTQAAVPVLRGQGGGLLIYVSSMAAKMADASGPSYQAVKSGVAALAHATMEEERAAGIRTSVIYPGLTDTPLVDQRPTPPPAEVLARALQPDDVAAACVFLIGLPARAHVPELLLRPSRP